MVCISYQELWCFKTIISFAHLSINSRDFCLFDKWLLSLRFGSRVDHGDLNFLIFFDLDCYLLIQRNVQEHLDLSYFFSVMGRFQKNFLDSVDNGHQVVLEHQRIDTPLSFVRWAWQLSHRSRTKLLKFTDTVLSRSRSKVTFLLLKVAFELI